jgi:hypothetical protein
MIEKVLDFKDINTKKELAKYISTELKFGYVMDYIVDDINWDAYSDLLGELTVRELGDDYVYDENDKGWRDYDDYLDYLEGDKVLGLKNEKGVRDDTRLIFTNFGPFMRRNPELAKKFLEFTTYALFDMHLNTWDKLEDFLKITICIES